jgi:hypothetical protein
VSPKDQPAQTKFRVPSIDAPNVAGARAMGLLQQAADSDISSLLTAIEGGRVSSLYVFDPGPDGSIGDLSRVVEARTSGRLPLLIVQGVLLTDLARAADFVLPGASYVEKEASYTNDQWRLQGTARAIPPPGEALDDWQILVNLSAVLGVPFDYTRPAEVRAAIAERFHDVKAFEGIADLTFAQPIPAQHWLQASNPSERWKWDFMFQDLPPVKGAVDPLSLPLQPGVIPLKEVK